MKTKYVLYAGFLVGVLTLIKSSSMPRGIRNNNAGNLEKNGIAWVGLSPIQNDSRFYQFATPEYGIRALVKVLKTYQAKHGINTVAGIIDRWAPPHENKTAPYIAHVASVLKVEPNQTIDINSYLPELAEAIIIHENGYNPYSMQTILNGIALA